MENVYVLMVFIAALIGLVGCGLLKVGDILEQKRFEKYYAMIKGDAGLWQKKLEQTGINVMEWTMDKGTEMAMKQVKEMTKELTEESDEEKVGKIMAEEADKIRKTIDDLDDELLPF